MVIFNVHLPAGGCSPAARLSDQKSANTLADHPIADVDPQINWLLGVVRGGAYETLDAPLEAWYEGLRTRTRERGRT